MIVYHLQPPPAQRAGGLEAAIQGLCSALQGAGVQVATQVPSKFPPGAVVHMHGLWQTSYLRIARQCKRERVPYVISPHGMLEPWAWRHKWWKKWPYYWLAERRLLRGAAALLATGQDEANRLRSRFPRSHVESLPLGMTGDAGPDYPHARAQLGWPPGERVLLFLSRLHEKKGLELLLQALALQSTGGPSRLVIVGDGEGAYVDGLKALAARLGPNLPRVDWVGPVWGDGRWPYFQAADLFCLPTYSENFGLAVLEALQVGTPVLTTRTTPWGAQLQPPRGFICDPEVRSVAGALREALSSAATEEPGAREALGEWARERFAWPRLIRSYLTVYGSLPAPRKSERAQPSM